MTSNRTVRCPICRGMAEAGCVYGSDRGWTGLRWRAGEPSFWSNVVTAWGGGQRVGNHGILPMPKAFVASSAKKSFWTIDLGARLGLGGF